LDKQERPRVSVAMAAFQGEKYIARQAESILSQLEPEDELVISVDPSADRTGQIVLELAAADPRVRVLCGPGRGAVRNFEHALCAVSGAVVFLSDQDDVWHPAKLRACLAALEDSRVSAVVHDAVVVDGDMNELRSSFFQGRFRSGVWRNVVKNRYTGCCMAFRREVLKAALPFPSGIPMHDQWIGVVARRMGTVAFLEKPLVFYRRHNQTLTGREKAGTMLRLRWRIHMIAAVITLHKRLRLRADSKNRND
jgi:glycosyltransferase involved in cell wall biosynthesis